uniref:polymorphic toxin-type HINT domain-containing protein n=1 Tax=Kitasatospora sp. MBT63 TaxID=1444768 RepID=UPI00053B4F9D
AYSNNNPINASDPSGLQLEECASGLYHCSHMGTQVDGPSGGGLPGGCSAFAYECGTGLHGTSDCATNWHPPCAPATSQNIGTVFTVNQRPGKPGKSGDGGGGGNGGGGGGGGNGRGTKKCGSWFSLDGAGCHISNGAKRTQNFTTDHPAVRAIVVTTVEIAAGTMCYAGGAAGALETGGATAVAAVAGCGAAVGALGSGLDNMLDGNADHSIKGQLTAEATGAAWGAAMAMTDGLIGPKGPKGPCNSFPAGTQVLLGDGSTKPIDRLTTADQVTATDPQTGTTAPEQVLATITTPDDQEFTDLTISTANGDRAPPATLTSTQHHPAWDVTTNRWTDAADLTAGDQLRQVDGTTATVESVHNYRTAPQTAYNLTVDDIHTYYVLAGNTPVLVHNCPGTATVHKFELEDGQHYTVEIRTANGESYNTHAMNPNGTLKPMAHTSNYVGSYRGSTTVPLPSPAAAIAYAKKAYRGSAGQGPYDALSNSCLTYCSRVIEAGGGEPLPSGRSIVGWIRKNFP